MPVTQNDFFNRIMNVLWDESPAAVKQVQERLKSVRPMAYNTVLTMMRILRDKGFLTSEPKGRADLYRPIVTREDMGRRSLCELIHSINSAVTAWPLSNSIPA